MRGHFGHGHHHHHDMLHGMHGDHHGMGGKHHGHKKHGGFGHCGRQLPLELGFGGHFGFGHFGKHHGPHHGPHGHHGHHGHHEHHGHHGRHGHHGLFGHHGPYGHLGPHGRHGPHGHHGHPRGPPPPKESQNFCGGPNMRRPSQFPSGNCCRNDGGFGPMRHRGRCGGRKRLEGQGSGEERNERCGDFGRGPRCSSV